MPTPREPINVTGGVPSEESRLRDEIAEAIGYSRPGTRPPGAASPCADWWRIEDGVVMVPVDDHPVPELDSDLALGWALRKIREAGWEWERFEGIWRAHNELTRNSFGLLQRTWASTPATNSDTLDAMELLLKVLSHGKDGATP